MTWMRLDKFISETGKESRSQARDLIRKGRITVNGEPVRSPEYKINVEQMSVCLDGEKRGYTAFEYYMLYKPAGVLSAARDRFCRTAVDLIDTKKRDDLFPVGRLDKDTEGLLLITNDGELAHRLLSPRKHVDKVYYVETDLPIPPQAVSRFAEGILLEDGLQCLPAQLEISGPDRALLTIHEGKFHQVKRMFAALGVTVIYLKRLSMGPLVLDSSLQKGEYRSLTASELERLKGSCK